MAGRRALVRLVAALALALLGAAGGATAASTENAALALKGLWDHSLLGGVYGRDGEGLVRYRLHDLARYAVEAEQFEIRFEAWRTEHPLTDDDAARALERADADSRGLVEPVLLGCAVVYGRSGEAWTVTSADECVTAILAAMRDAPDLRGNGELAALLSRMPVR
jgi:hypothetical protein